MEAQSRVEHKCLSATSTSCRRREGGSTGPGPRAYIMRPGGSSPAELGPPTLGKGCLRAFGQGPLQFSHWPPFFLVFWTTSCLWLVVHRATFLLVPMVMKCEPHTPTMQHHAKACLRKKKRKKKRVLEMHHFSPDVHPARINRAGVDYDYAFHPRGSTTTPTLLSLFKGGVGGGHSLC